MTPMTPPVVPSHLPMSSLHRPCHLERLLPSLRGNALQALPNHKVHQTSSTKLWTPGMLGIRSFKRSIYFTLKGFRYLWYRIHVSPLFHIQLSHFQCLDAKKPSTPSVAHWQNPSSAVHQALPRCRRWRLWRGAVEDLGSPTTARTRRHPKHPQVEPWKQGKKSLILGPVELCGFMSMQILGGVGPNKLPFWFMYLKPTWFETPAFWNHMISLYAICNP